LQWFFYSAGFKINVHKNESKSCSFCCTVAQKSFVWNGRCSFFDRSGLFFQFSFVYNSFGKKLLNNKEVTP